MNRTDKSNTLSPNKWVDNYADYLFNYAIVRVNDSNIAKDLVQETFFAGLKSAKNFEGKSTERTWLVSILKRKIIDYYRKINSKKGQAEVRMNFYDNGENEGNWIEERVPQSWNNEAEKSIENNELKSQIDECIGHLPEKYAMVFRMKTIQEFETEEICKELDITPSNLWVIIHRARTQLRNCMEKNWFNK
ncbi:MULTISPECIES: sigma-70 family RNA polymerase sigma factor [Tenacibaculum]|uniref:Sigma-70 family RNA polymerase sigma factor n=1 Tax=Tenacibaculum aiptasiae TaxID=426481 RepID=A0A7J5ASX4_9FLAO|nr:MULTISPECIES: sigma-70 family RNA polymerase sigma factor [Tenacibaculum]KAB1160743.1 sigma-70 family RNA polymerase sigma factor [Tenacibaculum aiptasiae]MCF2874530.1 sigma-70 family RNA polymerase sigma factor [Tenacibaculum sp. Cn5-1]MCF2934404.1 sigma-70 family RNA polymerase sigma factor [Tenacibaculum sp. Cn5-34]MCG7510614.1 sigma-70 family RNA polymerase sigma factor [Tenacibaculum sp. Cn5-46]